MLYDSIIPRLLGDGDDVPIYVGFPLAQFSLLTLRAGEGQE